MSNLIIPDHVQNLIANICKKYDIEEDEMKIRVPVEPGENWLAQILEVNVFGKSPNGQPHKISLIVKLAPTLDLYRNFFPVLESYQREAYTYNVILPEFEKIQKDQNVKNLFLPFAHCYQTYMGKFKETIILENMSERGYQSVTQKVPVDFQHASLIMKMFGKFHALSFAMRLHKPELFKKIGMNTRESFVNSCFREHYTKMIGKLGKQILNRLDDANIDFLHFLENPDFIIDKIVFPEIAGEHAVVCYGDAQTRNMLFRYEIYRDDPCEFCLCLDGEMFCWWQDCPPTLEGPCRDRLPFSPCANGPRTSATPKVYKLSSTTQRTSSPKVTNSITTETIVTETANPSSDTTDGERVIATTVRTQPPPKVCVVMGKEYEIGASLPHDTGNCVECICGAGAQVTCSPHQCGPPEDEINDYRPPGPRPQLTDTF